MNKYLFLFAFLICFSFSHTNENNINPADFSSLKQFAESAEEFSEQFTYEVFDADAVLGNGYEFLENFFPGSLPEVPTITENHSTCTSLLITAPGNLKTFSRELEKVDPVIFEYSLVLPLTFYHPPRV